MYTLGKTSAERMMAGVHPLLISCVCLAMRKYSNVDFGVGANAVRTIEQQSNFVARKLSKTMNSKHLIQPDGYSHAVDLYPVGYDPKNKKKTKEQFDAIVYAMEQAAWCLGIKLECGHHWGWDSPHFEISKISTSNVDAVKSSCSFV